MRQDQLGEEIDRLIPTYHGIADGKQTRRPDALLSLYFAGVAFASMNLTGISEDIFFYFQYGWPIKWLAEAEAIFPSIPLVIVVLLAIVGIVYKAIRIARKSIPSRTVQMLPFTIYGIVYGFLVATRSLRLLLSMDAQIARMIEVSISLAVLFSPFAIVKFLIRRSN